MLCSSPAVRELQLSCKPQTRSWACSAGAVRAKAAVGLAGTAQILKAILGSAMCSQTSDIWEVLPTLDPHAYIAGRCSVKLLSKWRAALRTGPGSGRRPGTARGSLLGLTPAAGPCGRKVRVSAGE